MTYRPQHMLLSVILSAFSLGSIARPVEGASNARLENIQAVYISELARINTAAKDEQDKLSSDYSKTLTEMKVAFQKQGNLDAVLAVSGELTRFNETQGFPGQQDLVLKLPALMAYQERYSRADHNIPVTKAQRVVNLATQYDASLQKTLQDLTKKGEIEAALLFKKERDGLWEKHEIVKARKLLKAEEEAGDNNSDPVKKQVEFKGEGADPAPDVDDEEGDETQEAIKKQYRAFCAAVLAHNAEKVNTFFPPHVVKFVGKGVIKSRIEDFEDVLSDIEDAEKSAIVFDEINLFGGRLAGVEAFLELDDEEEALPKTRWSLRDETWYLDINSLPRPEQEEKKRPDKRPAWGQHKKR